MCVYVCKLLFVFGKPPLKHRSLVHLLPVGPPFSLRPEILGLLPNSFSALTSAHRARGGSHHDLKTMDDTWPHALGTVTEHQESGPRWTPDGPYRRSKGWMVTKTQEICYHMFFTSQWPSGSRVRCLNWMVSSPNKCQNQKSVLPWPS